jgi:hypothetical protein
MMRFGFVCLLFVTASFFSLAQVVPDTTQINIGDKTIIVIDANPTEKPAPISENIFPINFKSLCKQSCKIANSLAGKLKM